MPALTTLLKKKRQWVLLKENRIEREEEMKKRTENSVNQRADLNRDRITEGKDPWPLSSLSNILVCFEKAGEIWSRRWALAEPEGGRAPPDVSFHSGELVDWYGKSREG